MLLLFMPWWLVFLLPTKLWVLSYLVGVAAVTSISAWIIGIRMRRRIKEDLGKTADTGDLSSVETWIRVDEVEQEKHPGRAWAPEGSDLGPDTGGLLDLRTKGAPPKSMPELDSGAGPDRGALIDFLPEDKRK